MCDGKHEPSVLCVQTKKKKNTTAVKVLGKNSVSTKHSNALDLAPAEQHGRLKGCKNKIQILFSFVFFYL